MSWLRRLRARIKYRRFEADLREELDLHRAMKEADLTGRTLSPADARRLAARAMGNVTLAREEARRVWIAPWLESVWQDGRYAVRSLRKSPGFALAAVLTLGIGIGFNASVFTMFNTLTLQRWNVQRPDEIVLPFTRPVGRRGYSHWVPHAEYLHLQANTQTLAALVASASGSGRVFQSDGADYDRPHVYVQFRGVSANFFDVMGIEIAHGRGFLPDEDAVATPAPIAVVTHGFWQSRLGGDPDVIGRTLRIGVRNEPVTIVGVTRRGFAGVDPLERVELFVPVPLLSRLDPDGSDGTWNPLEERVEMAGRLEPGGTVAAAEAELDALSRQFRKAAGLEGNGLVLTGTRPIGQPEETARFLPTLMSFGAAVLLVLLLACANVGNLQLARAFARQRELAVRLSLGAGRIRVVRQLLTEAGCVALAAAALGFGIAWFLPNLVMRLVGEADEVVFRPDVTVVGVAMLLGGLTVLLFALAPALRATRAGGVLALCARTDMDRGGRRLRSLLLASQVALSLTLLTGASLLTRGTQQAHSLNLGFDAAHVAVARIGVPEELYTQSALTAIVRDLEARLGASGLGAIARTTVEPLDDSPFIAFVRKPDEAENWNRRTFERELSPAGFALLGLAFVSGGPYSDRPDAREAVINQTLARELWSGEEAVGRTVIADDELYTIIGVVRDTYYTSPMTIDPVFHRAPALTSTSVLFRTDRPDAAARVRAIVQAIEPRLRLTIVPVTANIDDAIEPRRTAANLAWGIGVLGLCLATIGVFGVFAYAVEERRREIGLRMALGARARDILRTLVVVNRWSVGSGLAVGLLLSVVAGFVLRSYLFGLSPLDPPAYLTVGALMTVAAFVATAIPARRALRVDPAVTLRSE